jgi:hypothetical protein
LTENPYSEAWAWPAIKGADLFPGSLAALQSYLAEGRFAGLVR